MIIIIVDTNKTLKFNIYKLYYYTPLVEEIYNRV